MKRVHFIAIGGAAMHNLALALDELGYQVTGSDDEIREPSKSRLANRGLLPEKMGWQPDRLNHSIDVVILGMHARADNPELLRAKELGLTIYSYPEFLFQETQNKKRIVIGGSHGKTSITSMVMHVLNYHNIDFDYMVGAQVEGFDTMVRLSKQASIAIFEGDEYLSSPIDLRPKFHLYQPHVGLISGIAWDHINVFPTFENYVEQFAVFADHISDTFIYYDGDEQLCKIADSVQGKKTKAYQEAKHVVENGVTYLLDEFANKIEVGVFGNHNMQNLEGAKLLCIEAGITATQFYEAIGSFKGAARRLEVIKEANSTTVFRDFAHSPSKLKATTQAVKNQFPDRKLVACMELHTFSSLKKDFLPQYKGAMESADVAFVYFDKATVEHKQLEEITKQDVANGFDSPNVRVYTDADRMFADLSQMSWQNTNLLLMSSGTFSGKDVVAFGQGLNTEN